MSKTIENLAELVQDFLTNGGRITKVKEGMPKDLKRLKRSGWQFGGKRNYAATIAQRNEKSDIFSGGMIARPHFKGKKFKLSF